MLYSPDKHRQNPCFILMVTNATADEARLQTTTGENLMAFRKVLSVVGIGALLVTGVVSGVAAQQLEQGGGRPRDPQGFVQGMGRALLGVRLEQGSLTVAEVLAGSPAEAAGLQAGDVITAINGTTVADRRAILEALAAAVTANEGAETTVTVSVTRGEEAQDLSVTLPAMPVAGLAQNRPQLGVTLEQGTLTVTEVTADSPAAAAGIAVGDTIIAVNGRGVSSAREVVRALSDASRAVEGAETTVTVTVSREGASVDLSVTLPERELLSENFPRLHRLMGVLTEPNADGTGLNAVIPFTLDEGVTLTDETTAAFEALGWSVRESATTEGVYELVIPAENLRDGLQGMFEMPLEGFEFGFGGMGGGRGGHGRGGGMGGMDGLMVPADPAAPVAPEQPQV
jgi:S1-C subfamily serine protease